MESTPEHPLIAGLIYEIRGLNVLVIPISGRGRRWVFHEVHLDARGNTFRGGRSAFQPEQDGRILRDGEPTGKTLAHLEFASEGRAQEWDPMPPDPS